MGSIQHGLPRWLAFIFVPLALQATTTIGGRAGLTVTVWPNGAYEIGVPGPGWRFSGTIGQALLGLMVQSGTDTTGGTYNEISFDFYSSAWRHGAIRSYTASRAVLFTLTTQWGGPNNVTFPSFGQYPRGLHGIAFSGLFAYPTFYGSNEESPWVGFDSDLHTAILAPVTHFMVAATGVSPAGALGSGISTRIATVPPGFTQQTLLVLDNGINQAFDAWGNLVTNATGKTRPPNDADVTLNRLGYWTDAGSTYYYATEPGMSYPATLRAVKDDFAAHGLPLGYMQLDSWFYPKGPAADWHSRDGGIFRYFAAAPPFSGTLANFQKALAIPLVTHSRWIDPLSPYRSQYRMSGNVSTDPQYWSDVSQYLAGSGVAGFEQDWLADKAVTDFNLTDADDFLDNMAGAMGQQAISVQYCSGTTRHFLQTARYGNVTTIRASEDRFDRSRWTNFLYASRLAAALGVWPFTDVLMSGETANLILATLSAGPVGVGDALGAMDPGNLARSVRADGTIVKPDVPIVPIDSSFWKDSGNALAPMVAATYSDFGSVRDWYLFLYPQGDITLAQFRLADVGLVQAAFLYDYFDGTGRVVSPGEWLTEDVTDFRYQVAAPIGWSGMALIGDTGHFATLGKKRIAAVTDDGALHVTVAFAAGETVRTLRGYSPGAASAAATAGSVSDVRYDEASGLFDVDVMPGADGTASVDIVRQ
jgi:hypothetical protein